MFIIPYYVRNGSRQYTFPSMLVCPCKHSQWKATARGRAIPSHAWREVTFWPCLGKWPVGSSLWKCSQRWALPEGGWGEVRGKGWGLYSLLLWLLFLAQKPPHWRWHVGWHCTSAWASDIPRIRMWTTPLCKFITLPGKRSVCATQPKHNQATSVRQCETAFTTHFISVIWHILEWNRIKNILEKILWSVRFLCVCVCVRS